MVMNNFAFIFRKKEICLFLRRTILRNFHLKWIRHVILYVTSDNAEMRKKWIYIIFAIYLDMDMFDKWLNQSETTF